MELDHVFVFVRPDGPEIGHLAAAGLTETYRRQHPGQGTENICYGFDNLFIELLWVNSLSDLRSPTIARTRLYERSCWRQAGTSPFGLAWRDEVGAPAFQPPGWAFRPPYLPAGMAIDVAADGDDPQQPMMFRSPGSTPPALWPPEKRGVLQQPAGLGRVISARLEMPAPVVPSATLQALAAGTILSVGSRADTRHMLSLEIERCQAGTPFVLELPWP